jgi:shikimate dehydrogenase
MAKAVVAALRDGGFETGHVVARNEATGTALAERYGFAWRPDAADLRPSLIVNATPIGMAGGSAANDLPLEPAAIEASDVVFDVVAMPAETPLIRLARDAGRSLITGAEVIALQAAEQFALYTGVRPTDDQIARASAYSRD